jgi:hypothetical protein
MNERDIFIKMALSTWQMQVSRLTQLIDKLSDEQLMMDTSPGRNSGLYLLGHLTAVSDNLLWQLGVGSKMYPELETVFISNPDKSGLDTPTVSEIRQCWMTVNDLLWQHFEQMPPGEWFTRHALVSEEDFSKEPHRNKLNMVINRAVHISYHMGQMVYLQTIPVKTD